MLPGNGEGVVLGVENLGVRYGSLAAVGGANLQVGQGELLLVLGSNGAGKSSLLGGISGMAPVCSGRVVLGGVDITGVPAARRRHLGVAHVLEGRGVFPKLSVGDNLKAAYFGPRRRRREAFERATDRFPILAQRWRQRAGSLSGGEQQMLVLGRALVSEPKFLLVDEPSLGLAPLVVAQLMVELGRLKAAGIGIVLVEQPSEDVLRVADRCLVMKKGFLVASVDAIEARMNRGALAREVGISLGPS
ncbi:MAG: ATP-binding cassette domain-containing protein [Actinomycetota bacterium]